MPPPGYEKAAVPIAILMADFFLEYMNRLYRQFDGDLLLPMVLGEIAHHNVSALFTAKTGASSRGSQTDFEDMPAVDAAMEPCNAFSLSASTGIPRETIRRKITQLVKLGYVRQNRNGQVFITGQPARDFVPEFNVITLNRLLDTARRIQALLERP